MRYDLDSLLDRYDDGTLTRRQLLGALTALAMPALSPPAAPSLMVAKQLNHATLYVRDVAESRQFYQHLFGMPILTIQKPGLNLAIGTGFIGLYPADPGVEPRIDHVCIGIDHFEADAVKRKLGTAGVEATIRSRGDTEELYFTDPNGIRIQVQDVRYRGGVGPLGSRNP